MTSDLLELEALFAGGAEPWLPRLGPVIAQQPDAAVFLGRDRPESIVPIRELTFQALKPNEPHRWKVVAFGQNPYPRVESATGIAMFDNSFRDWGDVQFGRVTSIRCLVKAAAMWKLGLHRETTVSELREMLGAERVVDPPAWFQALLAQGVLLLNASLTASTDEEVSAAEHAAFWKPVVVEIVRGILEEKDRAVSAHDRGVVFAWWGTHARALRRSVEVMAEAYPRVRVVHVDHVNPAAMGDAFCDGDPFGAINDALRAVGGEPVDWLPSVGWDAGHAEAERMGEFIADTMEAHQQYVERLQGVAYERDSNLSQITGILSGPPVAFESAVRPLVFSLPNIVDAVFEASAFARERHAPSSPVTHDEIAAVHLYTTQTAVFRALNAALRDPSRDRVTTFAPYLRLLLTALSKLQPQPVKLYRGVATDLRGRYPMGREVVWWGVSSCTSNPAVAQKYMGKSGRRTLFEITPRHAVEIRAFSKYQSEEEYVLLPGTRLRVQHVVNEPGGLSRIELEEVDAPRLVS